MTPFEEQLKQAMARREPPADFTARVLEQARRNARRKGETGAGEWARRWFDMGWAWRWAALAAGLALMSGGVFYQQRERAARGEAAKEQLLNAVRIAGVKLHEVHRHVLEVEIDEGSREVSQ